MTVVLMDTRHHKTLTLRQISPVVLVPMDTGDAFVQAEFTATGDRLLGDLIYYQSRGPSLPDTWWHR